MASPLSSHPSAPSTTLFDLGWHVGTATSAARPHTCYPHTWPEPATLVEKFGDRYVAIGPWRPDSGTRSFPFEAERGFEGFEEACRAVDLTVRVGRWTVPGFPRTILVDGSALATRRDALLAALWNAHGVDSLFGASDYVDRVLFAHAAGMALERWWAAPRGHNASAGAVGVFHGWEAAAGLLYAVERVPDLGTVLALPGTVLGSRLARAGRSSEIAQTRDARGAAEPLGLRAEHSLESAAAREADVLLTLSESTPDETVRILGRRADVAATANANGNGKPAVNDKRNGNGNGHGADPVATFAPVFAEARRCARERAARIAPGVAPDATAAVRSLPLPPDLRPLERLARNYWWTWDAEGRTLFAHLSAPAWEAAGHDAVRTLALASADDLARRAADFEYVERVRRVASRFDAYMAAPSVGAPSVAYFSAEYGIHESLAIYSGGLGVLAGDHLKSASDLGLPLVAVGIFYRRGRQTQRLSPTGDQVLTASVVQPFGRALDLVRDADGKPLEVTVDVAENPVRVRSWRVHVGRVTLYLLDSDVEENRPEDRGITHVPYPTEPEKRLAKEIILGRGGLRLLARLGVEPAVLHLNEGHPAFAALERVAWTMQAKDVSFDEAVAAVRGTTAFTTHTPVPAGHDRFEEALIRSWLPDLPDALGVSWERVLPLGREEGTGTPFNMTRLAISLSFRVNAVSRLHAEVSRKLLAAAWPGVPEVDVPVVAVTNGVHLPTWTHPDIARLLGTDGRPVAGEDYERRAADLDRATLWAVRRHLRRSLLQTVRARLESRQREQGVPPHTVERLARGLDEGALLVGFARRFTAYKRGALFLRDVSRLERIVQNEERPVRFFFAGKAHRDDIEGQRVLRQVAESGRHGPLAGRVFFLEDYEIALARRLVQGVDVWLNTPVRGLEASGTSGMKVAANGGLNLSVLDGWWAEAFDGENGWAVGPEKVPTEGRTEDEADADALYALLENDVVPLFFERDADGVPLRWLDRVKRSLATIPPFFNTDRMVREYAEGAYGAGVTSPAS